MNQLDSIPLSFQKSYSSKCNCCEAIKTETITYELKIEFISRYDKNYKERRTYLLFYKPKFYCNFSKNPPMIGENTGTGKENIEELVEEIKKLI